MRSACRVVSNVVSCSAVQVSKIVWEGPKYKTLYEILDLNEKV